MKAKKGRKMASRHPYSSMIRESLCELLKAAEYCINYRKDGKDWGVSGCYGYAGALLLFTIADCIGSFIKGGNIENHFQILRDLEYYNLGLTAQDVSKVYKLYRSRPAHHAAIADDISMDVGSPQGNVLGMLTGSNVYIFNRFF